MSLLNRSNQTLNINTFKSGVGINITNVSNTSESTCNVKISSNTSQKTSLADDDILLLEDSGGNVKYITGLHLESHIDTNFWSFATPNIYPKLTSENLLVGTTSNSDTRKLLVNGTSQFQGVIYSKGAVGEPGYINIYDTDKSHHTSLYPTENINANVYLPNISTTLIGTNTTDTLTFKTLTSPTITGTGAIAGVFTGNLTGNADTSTKIASITNSNIVQLTDSQTLTNKTFGNNTIFSITPTFNATLRLNGGSGISAQLDMYAVNGLNFIALKSPNTLSGDFVLTLPAIDDTLITKNSIDILTSKTLKLPKIFDTSDNHNYIFAVSELLGDRTITLPLLNGNDTFVFNDHAQTLTNKTFGNNTIFSITPTFNATLRLNGGSGISGKIDLYDIDGSNYIAIKSQDTLSNDFTLTLPAIDDTLITKNSIDILTNKTISSNSSATLTALEVNTNPIQVKGTSGGRGYINFYDNGLTKHISLMTETTIGGASNSYNLILPSIADTLTTKTSTDILTNKTLSSTTNTITTFTGNSSSTITTPSSTGTLALFTDIATVIGSSTSVSTTSDLSNTTRVFGNSSCVADINGSSLSVPTSINATPSGLSEGKIIQYDSGLGGGNGSMIFGDNGTSASVNWDTGIYAKQFINMKCGSEVLLKLDRTPLGVKTITIDGSLTGDGGTLLSSSDAISVKQDSKLVNTTNTECFLKFGNTLLENTFHRSQFVKLTIAKNTSYDAGTENGYIELAENGTTSNTTRLYFNNLGTAFIFYDGTNLINTPSFAPSDKRVKKNETLADTNLLATSFDNIDIYKYQYEEAYAIDKGADPNKFVYGYIAQEVKDNTETGSQFSSTGSGESIYPNEKIDYEGEKLKVNDLITVNKTDLNILLWAKCKEQQKQIDTLKTELENIKSILLKNNIS